MRGTAEALTPGRIGIARTVQAAAPVLDGTAPVTK